MMNSFMLTLEVKGLKNSELLRCWTHGNSELLGCWMHRNSDCVFSVYKCRKNLTQASGEECKTSPENIRVC